MNWVDKADDGEEGEGVAAHDGGGGVGEPEKSYGDCNAGDGDPLAQDGVEEQWDEGGSEELGVGSALVCGEEHVGVHRVEDCGDECGGGWGEVSCEFVEGEAACSEG